MPDHLRAVGLDGLRAGSIGNFHPFDAVEGCMSNWLQDLKFTWRALIGRPAFALTSVLTLALGIGMNAAVFSLFNAMLLRPLPVHEPQQLVELYASRPDRVGGVSSYLDLQDLRAGNTVFTGLAGRSPALANLTWDGRSELRIAELATSNYFDVLGIRPHLGRFFTPEEERSEGAAPVVVLNYGFWQSRFNGDPAALGKTLNVNGKVYEIVGVGPIDFAGMFPGIAPEFWIPIMMANGIDSFGQIDTMPSPGNTKLERRGYRWFWVTGRLKENVSLAQASAEMKAIAARLEQEYPRSNQRYSATLIPTNDVRLNPELDGIVNSALLFVLVAVGIVLLVVCTNVAGMFLARSSARRREIALRLALGTGRWRLIRQLLMESTAIALVGGVIGLGLAFIGTRLMSSIPLPLPITIELSLDPDWRVFLYTFAISIITGIVFGLAPALQSTRTDLVLDLKGQHSDEARGRWAFLRNGLVVGQLALSLMLLIGSVLLARSLGQATQIDVGFRPDRFALIQLNLTMYGYDDARARTFYDSLQQRLLGVPGVESVTTADRTPFSININTTALYPTASPEAGSEPFTIDNSNVGPEYFDTMQIPIVEGRAISRMDTADAPRVAVVSEAFAKRFWPGESAVGKQVSNRTGRVTEIVGVSRDYKVQTVGETPRAYIHFAREQVFNPSTGVVVRTAGPPEAVLPALRSQIAAVDSQIVPFQITTLGKERSHALMPVSATAGLLGAFGLFTVFLAAIGLYGVIAYSVGRRTREIGTRMAIGATPGDVLRQVVGEGLKLVVLGALIGWAATAAASRVMQSLLYGISGVDPASFLVGTVALALVALVANIIPAWRASKIDPMRALRAD